MFLRLEFSHLFLFSFCVYLECVLTVDVPLDHAVGKDFTKEGNTKHSADVDNVFSLNKKSDNVIEIPVDKSVSVMGQSKNEGLNKEKSQLVLEGGGMVDMTSTAQPNDNRMGIGTVEKDNNHSKGSKPRKGVQHPGSSVVPRKGVDPLGAINLNQSSSSVTSDSTKESINAAVDIKMPSSETEPPKVKPDKEHINEKVAPKMTHPKKPVVVTDIEDVDDFDKYPIIQTSTTGEDYIIIGIVIVLGIWCSIFGALIFYRRAGEYWDRRHYRRMDFLVEGMYND